METKNGRIIFNNPTEWVMTDPDNYQFARNISDTAWEYIQLGNDKVMNKLERKIVPILMKHERGGKPLGQLVLELLSNETDFITKESDWYHGEIDVNDYDSDDIGEYLSSYGEGYLGVANDEASKNQLICEAIFETDMLTEFY